MIRVCSSGKPISGKFKIVNIRTPADHDEEVHGEGEGEDNEEQEPDNEEEEGDFEPEEQPEEEEEEEEDIPPPKKGGAKSQAQQAVPHNKVALSQPQNAKAVPKSAPVEVPAKKENASPPIQIKAGTQNLNTTKGKTATTKANPAEERSIKPKKNQIMVEEEEMMGDQAGIEQPWQAVIDEPDYARDLPKDLKLAPKVKFDLEYVFGYRTRDTRNNLRYISSDIISYHTNSMCILHDISKNTQSYLYGHKEDIISFSLNSNRTMVASGENSLQPNHKPALCLWDTEGKQISRFEGMFEKGINTIAFSPESTKLGAVTNDDDHTIFIFDLIENKLLLTEKGDSFKILDLCFKNENEFVTVGIKHYRHWMIDGRNITFKEGNFGETDNKIGLVAVNSGNFVTGSATGEITLWKDEKITLSKKCHAKNVDCIYSRDNL